jgi:hypothetical protein
MAVWSCMILWATCFTNMLFLLFYMCNFWWLANISKNTTQRHNPEDRSLYSLPWQLLNIGLFSNFSQASECVKWDWLSHVKCSLLFWNVLYSEIVLGNQLYQWQVSAWHFRDCLGFNYNRFMWWVVYAHAVLITDCVRNGGWLLMVSDVLSPHGSDWDGREQCV